MISSRSPSKLNFIAKKEFEASPTGGPSRQQVSLPMFPNSSATKQRFHTTSCCSFPPIHPTLTLTVIFLNPGMIRFIHQKSSVIVLIHSAMWKERCVLWGVRWFGDHHQKAFPRASPHLITHFSLTLKRSIFCLPPCPVWLCVFALFVVLG